jgi:hypothetical protein
MPEAGGRGDDEQFFRQRTLAARQAGNCRGGQKDGYDFHFLFVECFALQRRSMAAANRF